MWDYADFFRGNRIPFRDKFFVRFGMSDICIKIFTKQFSRYFWVYTNQEYWFFKRVHNFVKLYNYFWFMQQTCKQFQQELHMCNRKSPPQQNYDNRLLHFKKAVCLNPGQRIIIVHAIKDRNPGWKVKVWNVFPNMGFSRKKKGGEQLPEANHGDIFFIHMAFARRMV